MERGIHDNMNLKKSEPHHATKEPSSGCIAHDLDSNNNSVSPLLNTSSQHKQNQEAETNKSYSHSCSISSSSLHATTPTIASKSSSNNLVGLKYSHLSTNTISFSKKNPSHSNIFNDLYKKIKASLSKPISLLRRKCSCFDINSLQVKENIPKPKTKNSTTSSPKPQIQTLSQNQITRNLVNHQTTPKDKLTIYDDDHHHHPNVVREEEEPPRVSLHVFQPSSPPKSRVMDEDVASDASSDLFEIEDFSTQATTLAYPIRPPMIECQETTTTTTKD